MLEQLPGAHQLKQYSFKYNPPFDITSLEGTAEQVSYFENVMSFFLPRKRLHSKPMANT